MIKNLLATVAAAGLLISPIAAQAATRAADAGVSMASLASADRAGAPMGAAEFDAETAGGGFPIWALVALFIAAGVGIVAGIESGENNESPGT